MSHETTAYLSVFNLFLTNELLKGCKLDNFESHNSLNLSFTNTCGLCSNFVECESFLELSSPDILALCKTYLDDSIDSGNFSVIGYLPLIRNNSITHMHGLAVYMRKDSFCMGLIFRKLYKFLLMFLTGFTSLSVLLLFHPSITFFVFIHGFWFYFM